MTEMILLYKTQMARISPIFPLSHDIPREDDRWVSSGIIFVILNGLRWRDVPPSYGPHRAIYDRFVRLSPGRVQEHLSRLGKRRWRHRRVHDRRDPPKGTPTKGQSAQAEALPRFVERTKGGFISKLHAVCDSEGRRRDLFLTAAQVGDYTGAAALLGATPAAKVLLADKGHDAYWLRDAFADRKIGAYIP